ncbi:MULTISPECIES: hypothetical protein [Pseudomonas]|jgi:hypothetical protein|nr:MULTISPECIES: hypothetical protein [Pseudomonas]
MRSSEAKDTVKASKVERLNAALVAYKAAKDAGKVRRVVAAYQSA